MKLTEREFNKIDPDAQLVKDSPCNICGRKSTARMRQYQDGKLFLFAVCPDHIFVLREIFEGMQK